MKSDAIPKRDQVTWCTEYLGMHNTFVVVHFILQYCSGKEYKGTASSVSNITSSNTYYLLYILPAVMVHTSRSYQYACYEEFRDNGMFLSKAN